MANLLEKFKSLDKPRRLSIIFGGLIFVGLFIILIGVLAMIQVVPYATYRNTNLGFEFKFPAYWKVVRSPTKGVVIAFVAPKDGPLDYFTENVNITIQDIPADKKMNLESFSKKAVSQLTGTFLDSIQVIQSVPSTLGGVPGYRFMYVGAGKEVTNPVLYCHAWTLLGNRAYIVTFTGMKSEYPKYRKKVEDMLKSFKFLDAKLPAAQPEAKSAK